MPNHGLRRLLQPHLEFELLEDAPTPLALALHAVALLVRQRLTLETENRSYPVAVHLIPPPYPISVHPADFSQTSMLIDRARMGTRH